ncbi:transcriptional regulator, Crp/Fnr family [hydrothermal vent metagenome]|uniref:Transcriptional regulator, Crp/Fnr family n=1 Tax=hydrothermal vent metagenome TaxID=652676 RepID=A0A1W1D5P6_9ZZZZ
MIDELKKIALFSQLNKDELKSLEKISTIKLLDDENILFYENEQSDYLYFLIDGRIDIYKTNTKGKPIILKQFFSQEFIAEISNFNNIPFPATAKSIGHSKILKIDYKQFKKDFLYHRQIAPYVIKSLSQKILALNDVISTQLTMDATQRVAKFLYKNEKCLMCIKHHQIAENLNITPVTFSRVLKKFKEENIIKEEKNKLSIDKDKLKKQFS